MSEILDHRALIASLPAETRRALCAQADGPGLLRFGVHAGAILGLGWAIMAGVPGWQLLMIPQGILLVFLFTALHETIHETAFRTPWLNTTVAWIAGTAVLLGPTQFRYFHFAHHRYTHDPERDPELACSRPRTTAAYALYMTGVPETYSRILALLRNAAAENRESFVPPRARGRVATEARLIVLIYTGAIVLAGPVLLWAWALPFLLGGPFLRAYLLAEHTLCPHVADMLSNTRTTFTNRLVRWTAWNMPYHTEHHAYPAVPFHRLPQMHAITAPHLRETEDGYARFNRRLVATFDTST